MTGTIPLKKQNMDKAVIDLIYDKQLEFTKEKGRKVSLEQTVNRMIKEKYLKGNFEKETKS